MVKRGGCDEFFRDGILEDVDPNAILSDCGLYAVEMRKAANDLAHHAKDAFVASGVDHPSPIAVNGHWHHAFYQIREASLAIDFVEPAARRRLPELVHRRVRLACHYHYVAEMCLVVRPPAVAFDAGRDCDALNA